MSNDEEKHILHFATGLSTERGKYMRRTCPSCGLDFKIEIDPAQLQSMVAPAVQRVGAEIGVSLDVAEDESNSNEATSFLYCPYCQERSKISETFTQETIDYIHRILMREVVLPAVHKAFSPLADLGRNSGGMFSISFEYSRGSLPPIPMIGPEIPDMKPIHFICCGKTAKVSDEWHGLQRCIFCGTEVSLF